MACGNSVRVEQRLLVRQPFGPYRVLGDPLAPLLGAEGSLEKARAIFAPGPDDALPPLPDYAELNPA